MEQREPLFEQLAANCPAWATATILLKDDRGAIVGYGWVERATERVVVAADAEGVKLLDWPAVGF